MLGWPAMQCVRDRYPALLSSAKNTMQLFMWQRDLGWHTTSWIVLRCLVPLMMLLMMHQPHLHQPWRLDKCDLSLNPCWTDSLPNLIVIYIPCMCHMI